MWLSVPQLSPSWPILCRSVRISTAAMTRDDLLRFMRRERYAVQASVSRTHAPQAAVVGIAVSDDFEIVFDTMTDSRKATNLRANPLIAFVIGSTSDSAERSVQYEGVAD